MESLVSSKWHGSIQGIVEAPLNLVWKMISQSNKLPEWMPMVEQCNVVEGKDGEIGYVREIIGDMFPQIDGNKSWIKEKLSQIDPKNYTYTYTMESSNVGLEGYTNTIQLLNFGERTTLVLWRFEVSPVVGSSQDNLIEYLGFLYKSSIKKLEMVVKGTLDSKSDLNLHVIKEGIE
ncbi:hypothetical protein SUGI_0867190 [Cryptomeria japonica]|nr:hypothetical protein SUGI_0867190 [Cryptomeria japonica]